MSDAASMFTDGAAYERLMGRWSQPVGDIFLDWIALPRGLRWLDVGCGNGAFTETLIARSAPASVVAIDPSEGQLAFARTRPGATGAQFHRGDAQALPFPDRSFDAAVMALVIAFLPDPAKAVAEMARVVRPGGWIAAYMWDATAGGAPTAPIAAAAKSLGMTPPGPPNAAASTSEAMTAMWRAAGLAHVDQRVIRIPVGFASVDDFWESNSRAGPPGQFIQALSPDTRAQLRARLQERLPVAADGSIAYEAFANAIQGRVPQ
jgi:ubiquinone/menaquinone biosynthesis C-methylase UbiE